MRQTIFLTIAKWWCNCVDLILEIVAHPWEPEELHYRRMLCTIFGQSWRLAKSEKSIINRSNLPTTYRELRLYLVENTRWYWHLSKTQHEMTPAWPEGAIAYLEALFTEMFAAVPTNETTIKAFRLMNEVGDKHVPKSHLPEKLGVDRNQLFYNIGRLELRLRALENVSRLSPFVSPHRAGKNEGIVADWRHRQWSNEDKRAQIEEMSVERLALSCRSYNCLKNANLQTVGDILRITETEAELLRKRYFSRKSLKEINGTLKDINPLLRIGMLAGPMPSEPIDKIDENDDDFDYDDV